MSPDTFLSPVIFSGEKVRPEYAAAVPDVAESVTFRSYRVLSLESLVRMKLTSYRDTFPGGATIEHH